MRVVVGEFGDVEFFLGRVLEIKVFYKTCCPGGFGGCLVGGVINY